VEQRDEGFLPPEPAGPEPDLGGGQQPPPQQPPPPAYQPPPGYQQPPPYQPPPVYHPPAPGYGWTPPPKQPDNNPALAGFITSAVSGAFWLFSGGTLTPLTIPGAIVGMVLARRGKEKVEAGETQKHKDLAQAGFWIGLAVLILSVLSTIAWVLFIVLVASTDSSNDSFNNDSFQDSESSSLGLGIAVCRVGVRLLS
jgi:hypothetical protein